jgi:hypothetical protein
VHGGTLRIKNHHRIMQALLRHQGGVLTIDKADRTMRDVWLVRSRSAEQRQRGAVAYRLAAAQEEPAA